MGLEDLYFGISVCVFLIIAKKICNVLYTFWLGPAYVKLDIKSYGKWAMVTGSTDGIGKEYARQLAARGCDIILVSRSLDKLKNVAAEIEKDFKVQTKIVQIDFASDLSIYDKLAKEIEGYEIGTLVNNVGVAYIYLEYFLDIPDWANVVTNIVTVNVMSMVRVTGLVMPGMVKRGKGIIINLGSSSNDVHAPLLAVYAASKAFVAKFSEELRYEYEAKGILIQCLSPSFISTNMTGLDSNIMVPLTQTYVKSALSMLGSTYKSSGYFPHSCLRFIINLSNCLPDKINAAIFRCMAEISQMIQLKKMNEKSRQIPSTGVPSIHTFVKITNA